MAVFQGIKVVESVLIDDNRQGQCWVQLNIEGFLEVIETSTSEVLEVITDSGLASQNTDNVTVVRVLYQLLELILNLGININFTIFYQFIRQINLASTGSNFVVNAFKHIGVNIGHVCKFFLGG